MDIEVKRGADGQGYQTVYGKLDTKVKKHIKDVGFRWEPQQRAFVLDVAVTPNNDRRIARKMHQCGIRVIMSDADSVPVERKTLCYTVYRYPNYIGTATKHVPDDVKRVLIDLGFHWIVKPGIYVTKEPEPELVERAKNINLLLTVEDNTTKKPRDKGLPGRPEDKTKEPLFVVNTRPLLQDIRKTISKELKPMLDDVVDSQQALSKAISNRVEEQHNEIRDLCRKVEDLERRLKGIDTALGVLLDNAIGKDYD